MTLVFIVGVTPISEEGKMLEAMRRYGNRTSEADDLAGNAPAVSFTGRIAGWSAAIPEAMVRFMTGPPTTERERFRRNVAVARTSSDWLMPR